MHLDAVTADAVALVDVGNVVIDILLGSPDPPSFVGIIVHVYTFPGDKLENEVVPDDEEGVMYLVTISELDEDEEQV